MKPKASQTEMQVEHVENRWAGELRLHNILSVQLCTHAQIYTLPQSLQYHSYTSIQMLQISENLSQLMGTSVTDQNN